MAKTLAPNYCTIYLARHGETEWNVQQRIQGHQDSPLTKNGKRQARQLSRSLRHLKFDHIFASDLPRAHQTAAAVARDQKLAVLTTTAIRERAFGQHEGRPEAEYRAIMRRQFEQFNQLSAADKNIFKFAPDIESIDEVVSRTITFLREIAVASPGKNVLAVTHGGVIRMILIHLGFGSHEELAAGTVANTAWVKLHSDGTDFFVQQTFGITKLPVN